ncbi:MAG TPA: ROK family transcriptional regulator [Solirubrobacter sp.]
MSRRDTDPLAGTETILQLIRDGEGTVTRAELMEQTGLARSTVGLRLAELIAQGLVTEARGTASTGGRPPQMLAFNAAAGVVLAVDAGASRVALAISDLNGDILAERTEVRDIDIGPRDTLPWVCDGLDALLAEVGRSHADVRCVGVGLPGSVDFSTGRPVSPLLMPGWDGFPVAGTLRSHFGVDVLVDGDANVMALGEARQLGVAEHLVVVKAGTGVGLGYVSEGVVQRGAKGCAGEIGHIRAPGSDDIRCRCGKYGCLEAVAGGAALAERLTAAGIPCSGAGEVAALTRAGVPEAIAIVRQAGHAMGFVLSTVVNVLNPARLVVAGDLANAHDFLMSALRETVYRESNTLATIDLEIARARTGVRAGLIGTVTMGLEHALTPDAISSFARG